MALADIPGNPQSRRLDSWKEIAEYLRRDVRTATRWESQGLPLHRIAGGKGRSVYAFTHEIDAWLAGRGAAPPEDAVADAPAAPVNHPLSSVRWRGLAFGALALVVAGAGLIALLNRSTPSAASLLPSVVMTANDVTVTSEGRARVIHEFSPGAMLREGTAAGIEDVDGDGIPEVQALVSFYETDAGRSTRSGELLNMSTDGVVRWRFVFDDQPVFGGGKGGPWSMADWQVEPRAAQRRIAVAAHDVTWWASLVAVLDHTGRRLGSFANPGWIESVMWQTGDRLAIAGFNNARDAAVFAVLDANHPDGQAPDRTDPEFVCAACASGVPLFYADIPRSEVNRITASRFNRARLSALGDHVVVTTTEMSRDGGDATALYEFDRNLRLIRARYSDIYWGEHERLELEGRLHHSRETCPDRNGPPAIHVWDAAKGWVRTTPAEGR